MPVRRAQSWGEASFRFPVSALNLIELAFAGIKLNARHGDSLSGTRLGNCVALATAWGPISAA
jgi:hypothetical protein